MKEKKSKLSRIADTIFICDSCKAWKPIVVTSKTNGKDQPKRWCKECAEEMGLLDGDT